MQELEKILEEMKESSITVATSKEHYIHPQDGRFVEEVVLLDDIEKIIHKHMNDGWIPVEDERLWNILFEEACVEGEQAMRLIDADKLYDWVRRECNSYGKPTIDFESGNRMLDMIKRSSTAFDKEKVIEELREELNLSDAEKERCARENPLQFDSAKGYANGIANAIEIVEKGGIE